MNKLNLITLILIAFLTLTACGRNNTIQKESPDRIGRKIAVPAGSYTDVSIDELQVMLENKDFLFINVHIPFEGNIPATDLSIPFDEIDQSLEQLPTNKDAKILLYCRSDRMSRIAAERLVELGYTNIWNLDGGFNAWENAGLPLEK
jgi:rhodanese-related sulfurtransferase